MRRFDDIRTGDIVRVNNEHLLTAGAIGVVEKIEAGAFATVRFKARFGTGSSVETLDTWTRNLVLASRFEEGDPVEDSKGRRWIIARLTHDDPRGSIRAELFGDDSVAAYASVDELTYSLPQLSHQLEVAA